MERYITEFEKNGKSFVETGIIFSLFKSSYRLAKIAEVPSDKEEAEQKEAHDNVDSGKV